MMHVTNSCKKPWQSNNEIQFSSFFNEVWNKTMVYQVITAGFKRAGIYPFNPDVIDYGVCDDSANKLSSDTLFIPIQEIKFHHHLTLLAVNINIVQQFFHQNKSSYFKED